ncbi:MAG: hypothetical protein ABI488_05720 [Polyangiaceae bacterium]
MKELIYSNFQLTRATGVPTMFTVDGVRVEMRKGGAAPAPAKAKKAKAKKARRPAKKASGAQEKPTEQPAKTSKPATARRAEAAPQ